jgi:hypothetical protein
MIEWIIRNKEWLFSGAGLAIAIAVVGVLRRVMQREAGTRLLPVVEPSRQFPASRESLVPTTSAALPMTLDAIYKDINSRPPFQREDAERSYLGVRLRYTGCLSSAKRRGKRKHIDIVLHANDSRRSRIFLALDEDTYPEVKVMTEGTVLTVEGRVTDLSYDALSLEEARIIEVAPNQPVEGTR